MFRKYVGVGKVAKKLTMADMLFIVGFFLTSNHAGLIYATVLSFRTRFARTSLVIPPTHC